MRVKRPAVRDDVRVRILDQFEAGVDRALGSARKRSSAFDHAYLAGERFVDVLGGRLAAAISYYAFFAAFSLAVLGYSILGRIVGSHSSTVLAAINEYLSDSLPWIADTAEQVGRGEVTTIAAVALVLSGIGWVEALRTSLRAVWRLEQHPGNWIIRRLVDLCMLIGLGLLLGLSLAMTTAIDQVLDWLAPDTNLGATLLQPFGSVLEFMVNLVLASAMLTAVPRLRLSPRRLVVPAVVVAGGIQLLNTVGRIVIARSERQPAYQLVAGAVGLLVYLYLLNQVIIFGASLAATATAGRAVDLAGDPGDLRPSPEVPGPDGPTRPTASADTLGEPRGPSRPQRR